MIACKLNLNESLKSILNDLTLPLHSPMVNLEKERKKIPKNQLTSSPGSSCRVDPAGVNCWGLVSLNICARNQFGNFQNKMAAPRRKGKSFILSRKLMRFRALF